MMRTIDKCEVCGKEISIYDAHELGRKVVCEDCSKATCLSDLQNTLSRDEIRIIQEYRKLPGWGTMTLTKADNSLKFIEKTDKIKI